MVSDGWSSCSALQSDSFKLKLSIEAETSRLKLDRRPIPLNEKIRGPLVRNRHPFGAIPQSSFRIHLNFADLGVTFFQLYELKQSQVPYKRTNCNRLRGRAFGQCAFGDCNFGRFRCESNTCRNDNVIRIISNKLYASPLFPLWENRSFVASRHSLAKWMTTDRFSMLFYGFN